jgi:micrococcal nuclease
MKQIIVLLVMVASFFMTGVMCGGAQAQDFSALREMDTARVIEVITPYTVQLDNGQIVRLSGVHYPDYNAEDAGDFAVAAIEILKDMLVRKNVRVFQTVKKDWGRQNRMGHALAHVQRAEDGLWVQGALIGLGLAQVKTSQRNPEMAEIMYELEREARVERLGIWADDLVLSVEETEERIGDFVIVEGKIVSVAMNKNRLHMNFGGNWRDDFTVSIPPSDLKRFSQSGLDPLQWGGQWIRVRGTLESYNGPAMEINHPEAIERIDAPKGGLQE